MKTAQELAEEFPEQNPGNFEHDAALRLNDWGIEAHAMLRQQAEQLSVWLATNGPGGWIDDLRNKCEALEITNAALKAALRWQPASGMLESIEALSNENLALKADAERYRYLRKHVLFGYCSAEGCNSDDVYLTVTGYKDFPKSGETVDMAIDAMKGKS